MKVTGKSFPEKLTKKIDNMKTKALKENRFKRQ